MLSKGTCFTVSKERENGGEKEMNAYTGQFPREARSHLRRRLLG
jgi:hypothetical protein